MSLSAGTLLGIVQDYWPSREDERQEPGPEAHRLRSLWNQKLQERQSWDALLDQMEAAFPHDTVADITATLDACFRCAVYPENAPGAPASRWVTVGCASIIAPVFTVFRLQFEYGAERILRQLDLEPPLTTEPGRTLSRLMESKLGARLLPPAIASVPVPLYVHRKVPFEATLFHALFTSTPERIP